MLPGWRYTQKVRDSAQLFQSFFGLVIFTDKERYKFNDLGMFVSHAATHCIKHRGMLAYLESLPPRRLELAPNGEIMHKSTITLDKTDQLGKIKVRISQILGGLVPRADSDDTKQVLELRIVTLVNPIHGLKIQNIPVGWQIGITKLRPGALVSPGGRLDQSERWLLEIL